MSFNIALAGKGGTGKTTVAGLIIKSLMKNKNGSILAVDADANANLNEVLGIEATETIGRIREELSDVPFGMTKDSYIEYRVQQALIEADGYDLIVMGRPEGAGCYCYANTLTKKYVDMLADNYKNIVIDNEAGMEHMSRRTTHSPDILLIVSDANIRGILAAKRLKDLAEELKLKIGKTLLMVNRAPNGGLDKRVYDEIKKYGLTLAAEIPASEEIIETELGKRSILQVPDNDTAFKAVEDFMKRYGK
jgi:CO dehydrogenase maturation factor